MKHSIFEKGNYVLIEKGDSLNGEKITLRRRGPRRVRKIILAFLYEIEGMGDVLTTTVVTSRLRIFHCKMLDITVEILAHVIHTEQGYVVQKLVEVRDNCE